MNFLAALAPLILAALGPFVGHAWLGHGLYKLALLIIPFLAGRRPGWPARLPLRLFAEAFWTGIALGGIAFVLTCTLVPRFVDFAALRAAFDARYHYTPATAILAAGLIMTANALLEEWFYRGFLDARIGIAASAAIFALQHIIVLQGLGGWLAALLAGLAVFPAGLIWSWIARRGGLLPAFISHALADAVLLGGGLWLLGYLG